MIKISKCSLNGYSVNVSKSSDFYELTEQTSYYPTNYYKSDSYENDWYPVKVEFDSYSPFCMSVWPASENSGSLTYVFDVKDAGDYMFGFKINKRFGFNPISNVSIKIEYPSGENLDLSGNVNIGDDIFTRSTAEISLQHNMVQGIEDSVWAVIDFPVLVPGRYKITLKGFGIHLKYLNSFDSIFYLEAVTAFSKDLFSTEGLTVTSIKNTTIFSVTCYRINNISEDHPLSKVKFLQTLKQGEAKIIGQFAKYENNKFIYFGNTISFSLDSFKDVDRYVISEVFPSIIVNESDFEKLCLIFTEHYSNSNWNFSYSVDESNKNGLTFIYDENEELSKQANTIAIDVFEEDEKRKVYKSYSVKLSDVPDSYIQKYNIEISPPDGVVSNIDDITDSSISVSNIDNFSLISDSNSKYYQLSLPERHQGFVLDHSGSMSWSDKNGIRFDLIRSILDKFDNIYPGSVSYSLVSFKGTPVVVQWFGAFERDVVDSNDPEAIRKAFLQNKFTNFRGCHIVRKKNSVPISPTDGDIVFSGFDKVLYDTGLEENAEYYYAIYSIDSNNRLGEPQVVRAKTRSKEYVKGIKSLNAKEFIGTGIKKNDSCVFIYHMNEFSGNKIYDFSGNRINLDIPKSSVNSITWLDEAESPPVEINGNTGKGSGLRFTGNGSYCEWNGASYHDFNGLNISMWIYPFGDANNFKNQIIQIGTQSGYISIKYDEEYFYLYKNEIEIFSISHSLESDLWHHISFDIDENFSNLYLYIDGNIHDQIQIGYDSDDLRNIFSNAISTVVIGEKESRGFCGRISEFVFRKESVNPDIINLESYGVVKDNGDRLLLLNWFSNLDNSSSQIIIKYKQELGSLRLLDEDIAGPANFGQYQGDSTLGNPPNTAPGRVAQSDLRARICYGDDIGPVSIYDGETIYDSSIDGDFNEWSLIKDFSPAIEKRYRFMVDTPGFRHFFRIFRVSEDGDQSVPDDSGLLEYTTASYEDSFLPDIQSEKVQNVKCLSGDKKIRINWDVSEESYGKTIIVYYSKSPIPENFLSQNQNGSFIYPVFAGDVKSKSFTHHYGRVKDSQRRTSSDSALASSLQLSAVESEDDLNNGQLAYYALVVRDRYGRLGEPVFVNGKPDSSDNDKNISPEKVIAARSYGVDFETISIKWINPVTASRFYDLSGWLDDNVVLYFKITDIYGRRIDEQAEFEISFRFNDYLSGVVLPDDGYGSFADTKFYWDFYYLFDVDNRAPIAENISFNELISYSVSNLANGWTRVVVNTNNATLSDRNYAGAVYTAVSMSIKRNNNIGSDPLFSFTTQPIRIYLKNPLSLKIEVNEIAYYSPQQFLQPSNYASAYTNSSICATGDNSGSSGIGSEFNLYGAYNGRVAPYPFVIKTSYRGLALPEDSSAEILVFEDNEPNFECIARNGCSIQIPDGFNGVVGYNPDLGTPRSRLGLDPKVIKNRDSYPESSTISPVNENVLLISSDDGLSSYGVGYLRVPNSKSFGRVFATVRVGEFKKSIGFYIGFISNLYIKTTISTPVPNGEDIANQYAYAYTIDPNRFTATLNDQANIENFITPVPDGTTIFWNLLKLRNSVERPFYSTTNRSIGGLAVDKTVNGYSNNVVFGPISNVNSSILQIDNNVVLIPEEYIITATVNYNGMTASSGEPACLYPIVLNSDQILPSVSQTSFYFAGKSFGKANNFVQYLYADGEDYAVLEVIKDPRLLLTSTNDQRFEDIVSFCKCYNADGSNSGIQNAYLTILPDNQIIEIKANKLPDCQSSGITPYIRGKIEILHGNSINYSVDEDGITQVSSTQSSLDVALINLESNNRSDIVIKSNTFIPIKWKYYSKLEADPGSIDNVFCDNLNTSSALLVSHNVQMSASTSVINNNRELTVYSDGGPAYGNPPKMIQLVEPLYLQFAYAKKNGVKLLDNTIDLDGVSEYEFTFVTKFGKRPVPDNTPVKFYKCGSNDIVLSDTIGYTRTLDDVGFWSYGPNGDLETSKASFVSVKIAPLSSAKPIFGSIFAEINYDKKGEVFRQRVCGIDLVYIGGSSIAVTSDNQSETGSGSNNTGNSSNFGGENDLSGTGSQTTGNTSNDIAGGTFGGIGGGNSGNPPGSDPDSSLFPFPEIVAEIDSAISRLLVNTAFSRDCYIYDSLVTDESYRWRKIASMNLRRAMHVCEYVNGSLYVFGGLAGYGSDVSSALATVTLTDSAEYWNSNTNSWSSISKVPSKRFGSLSCSDGRFVYVIGGFETRIANVSVNGQNLRRRVPFVSRRFERYDTVSGTWATMPPMPVFDTNGNQLNISADIPLLDSLGNDLESFDKYGVALGKAFILEDKIVILCGSRSVDSSMMTKNYNDKILIYDMQAEEWYCSEKMSTNLASQFSRNYPVVWEDINNIYITGGSSSIVENINAQIGDNEFIVESNRIFALQNSFTISKDDLNLQNINLDAIKKADFKFSNIIKSRDQVSYGQIGLDVYVLGGRVFSQGENFGTNATKSVEKISLNFDSKYSVDNLLKSSFGFSSSGFSSDNSRLIYITGGITTNQAPGFVRLDIEVYGEQTEQINAEIFNSLEPSDAKLRLDGFSGCDIKVMAYDDEGELINGSLQVELSGLLAYGTGDEETEGGASVGIVTGPGVQFNRRRKRKGTRVYPIVIDPRIVNCINGIGYARLDGRSEDILRSITEIQEILNINLESDQSLLGSFAGLDLKQGKVRFPYRITITGRVIDDFYFGKTSFISSDPVDNAVENFLPENELNDIIADAGEFGSAVVIPTLMPAYASERSPLPISGLGPVLTVAVIGVIGPKGDTDLYKFTPDKTGLYIITIENRGFSTLKANAAIFTSDFQPYPIGGTGNNIIQFDGYGFSNTEQAIELLSGFTYYIQVGSYATAEDPETNAVGSYNLRITIPISHVQNDNNLISSSSSSSSNDGGGDTERVSFDIFEYIDDSIERNLTSSWASILRDFYNNYFRILISTSQYNEQALNVAVQTINGLASCPFQCPVCIRRQSDDSRPSCERGVWDCDGSDNVVCTSFTGNGNLELPSSSSFSSSSSQSIDFDSYFSPYHGGNEIGPIDLAPIGKNEFIIEDLTFDTVEILASSIFSSESASPLSEGNSPIVQFYSDIDWIPEIDSHTFTGQDASEKFRKILRKIEQTTPFGSSPIYDGIQAAANIISAEFNPDNIIKNIIVISDNDENTSGFSPLQNIEAINGIDGPKKVKVNAFNVNTFNPVTISAQASKVNTASIGEIISETGGQNFALFSEQFLEDASEFAFTGSAGSAGAGKLSLIVNFDEEIIVNKINPIIQIGSSDLITYSVSYSLDGENYVDLPDQYEANQVYNVNVKCSFIKININGILDFSKINKSFDPYDAYNPYSRGPISYYDLSKIKGIGLELSASDETFIYLKPVKLEASPQQVVIFINWSGGSDSLLEAGVSTSDSGDWSDFSRDAQELVPGLGKVIIPLRDKDKFGVIKEYLKQITPYVFEFPHGSLHRNSKIELYDENDEVLNSSFYDINIDSGFVRFQSSMNNKKIYSVINNENIIKVGFKASFGVNPQNIIIKNVGYMLTVNKDQAPQQTNQPPVAIYVRTLPSVIYPYTNVSASYKYVDQEGDVESVENRIIKWYKNGVEIPELKNITSYNDLHNTDDITYDFFYTENYADLESNSIGLSAEVLANYAGERFFEPGDELYFTIQVHDGNQLSSVYRSPTITVSNYPASPSNLIIRSRYAPVSRTSITSQGPGGGSGTTYIPGQVTTEVSNRTDLFLDFDLFSPSVFDASIVKWYVIDNIGNTILFKAGRIADASLGLAGMSPIERNIVTGFEAIMVGHQIYAELFIPQGSSAQIINDITIRSNTVLVSNIVPSVLNLRKDTLTEASGGTEYWVFSFSIIDEDISQDEPNQSNQSTVRVWRKSALESFFTIDSNINPLIPFPVNDLFDPGDTMYVEVIPYDGIAYGASVKSEEYTIS